MARHKAKSIGGTVVFASLHTHSYYSMDGLSSPLDLCRHAKALGHTALALTEHGHLASAYKLHKAAKETGIKPIYGCEFYVKWRIGADWQKKLAHITVLVENKIGWGNMVKLTQIASGQVKKKVQYITLEQLEIHGEGLIILSGCLASVVGQCHREAPETARMYLEWLSIAFHGRAYGEVQDHGMEDQRSLNAFVRAWSNVLPTVATVDAHWHRPEQMEIYRKLHPWIEKNGLTLADLGLRTPTQFVSIEEVKRTLEIADRVDFDLEPGAALYYRVPDRDKYIEWAKGRLAKAPKHYKDRLDYELGIIESKGFLDYFTLLARICKLARDAGIPTGPGRGSAAGSLLSFLLNITQVDPIKHDLLFERFMNPDRDAFPDIDLDVSAEHRSQFLGILQEYFGHDSVMQVCTYLTRGAKVAINDAARCLGMSQQQGWKYSKLVPSDAGFTWSLQKCVDELEEFKSIPKELKDLALALEGNVRGIGVHAAAILIAPGICNEIPHYGSDSAVVPMTCLDMNDCEAMGYVKFDLLGLKTLSLLQEIECRTGIKPQYDLQDKATFDLISSGETAGVFQLEAPYCQQLQREINIQDFNELADVLALNRPAVISSGLDKDYVRNKRNPSDISYLLPELKPILQKTKGVMIYQETTLEIAQKIAGLSGGEADNLRRAIGKKKKDLMATFKEKFIKGANK